MKWVLYVWDSALRGSFDIALRLFFLFDEVQSEEEHAVIDCQVSLGQPL